MLASVIGFMFQIFLILLALIGFIVILFYVIFLASKFIGWIYKSDDEINGDDKQND